MTENQSGCLVLFHITVSEARGGPDAAKRQVIQIAAGFVRTRRKRLSRHSGEARRGSPAGWVELCA